VHEAFDRGLHAICEKPLAMDASEARLMADHAIRAKRVLYPGHSYRHAPVVRAVREVLARGDIGNVTMATVSTFRTTHAKGVPEWRTDWRRERAIGGGGILMDHGPHTFYLAFEWLRSHPTSVSAWTADLSNNGQTEDDVVCALTFPTGVVRAHLSWNAGVRRVIYTLHGDKGALIVEDDDLEITIKGHAPSKLRLPSDWANAGHPEWFEGVVEGFERAIDQRDWVSRETEDSVRAMETISAAYASATQGGRTSDVHGGPHDRRGRQHPTVCHDRIGRCDVVRAGAPRSI
jgi:predicted dehydrogenase